MKFVKMSIICLLIVGILCTWVYGDTSKKLPIYRVKLSANDMRIAITFDCAWGAQDIPELLNILETYDAKATFFVLGTWAEKNPETCPPPCKCGEDAGFPSVHELGL